MQYIAQLHMARKVWREVGTVCLAQGRDQRVAVLPANLAIFIPVPLIKAWLLM